MGNLNSLLNSAKGVDNVPEVEVGGGGDEFMSTPVPGGTKDKLKSKPFMALLDPRSPTVGVSRTPVEIIAERERERKSRMQKLAALSLANSNAEQESDAVTPSGFIDPRSPTFEYKRTPLAFDGGVNADGTNKECPMEQTPTNDKELQVPVSTPVIRDLRKRLFVSQLNDSLNASGMQEDNKEN